MTYLLLLLLAGAPAAEPGPAPVAVAPAPVPSTFDHTHAPWTALLARYVRGGVVDYTALAQGGRPALQAYLASLSAVDSMVGWTRQQQVAFWINAYNAWTLELILQNPGTTSIRSITWFTSPWKIALAPFERLGRGTLTLDDIEHGILRKDFADPRLHMVLVCASQSCPALRSEAFQAARLDRQLDEEARRFLGDKRKNQFDLAAGEMRLSSIFKWYGDDFAAAGGVHAWISRYVDAPTADAIRAGKLTASWLDYDWSLNDR